MSAPACPDHGAGPFVKPSQFPPGSFWCTYPIGGVDENGKPKVCKKKIKPVQDAVGAPGPTPTPAGAQTSDSRSPRLHAAIAALSASSRIAGTPAEVMTRASVYYYRFLMPSFTGDVPQAFDDDDINF